MAMRPSVKKNVDFMQISPFDTQSEILESHDIKSGSWIMVTRTIPVSEFARPVVYGIYWGIPVEDRFHRQKIAIYTPSEVCILNYEYSVISEEKLATYRKLGYEIHETSARYKEPLNLELIQQGRALCEEEREIIWALMLDGITETQACEEYFMSRHTDASNINISFLPPDWMQSELRMIFGDR